MLTVVLNAVSWKYYVLLRTAYFLKSKQHAETSFLYTDVVFHQYCSGAKTVVHLNTSNNKKYTYVTIYKSCRKVQSLKLIDI
jgi:hypothetical protein